MHLAFLFLHRVGRIALAIGLALLVFYARHQFNQMDERFFQPSLPGAKALALYLFGDYSAAAKAYRVHFQEAVHAGWTTGNEAEDAFLRGDLRAAQLIAQKTLEANQTTINALVILGQIALEQQSFNEALRLFNLTLQIQDGQPEAVLLSAVAHSRSGLYGEAIEALNGGLRTGRISSNLISFLQTLQTTGDLAQLQKGERPLCLLAHYYRYLRIFDPMNRSPAIRYAKQAIAAGDRPADAYLAIGVVYEKSGEPELALEALQKAIEIDPKHAESLRWSAVLYRHRGDVMNEYRMSKAAFEAKPGDSFYLTGLHHALVTKLGDYHQAKILYEWALTVKPDNVQALEHLGYVYGFIGEDQRAVEAFRRAIQLDPRKAYAHEGLGYHLGKLGQTEKAVTAYRNAQSLDPYRVESRTQLADLYFKHYRYRDAVKEYKTALSMGERDTTAQIQLCLSYFVLSEFQNAVDCIRPVVARDPTNHAVRMILTDSIRNLKLQAGQS
jgi:tetratricopeptide (TPR) repeat protein